MKKVLFTATISRHIITFHLPYMKMLKEQGYEVHVAANGDEEIDYCDVKHKICFERSPLKINNLKAIKQLKSIIEKEKFDIIHTHTPMGSVVTRLAAKRSRKNGTRVIYTAHGLHFFKGAPKMNWLIFYPIEKYLSKYTDDIILINKEDYELAKSKFDTKNIHYVPGVGVSSKKFEFAMTENEKLSLRNSLGVNKNDFVIIYTAELNNNKNQSMAIKAISELVKEKSNIKLLLAGKDSLNGKYQSLVKELGLEKQVLFLGYRNDIPKLLKIVDLVISTSRREGLPVNLMEALVAGKPIIATNSRGNKDVMLKSGNDINISCEDYLLLASEIKKYKDQNITIKNPNEFKEFYSQERCLDMLSKIYFDKK